MLANTHIDHSREVPELLPGTIGTRKFDKHASSASVIPRFSSRMKAILQASSADELPAPNENQSEGYETGDLSLIKLGAVGNHC